MTRLTMCPVVVFDNAELLSRRACSGDKKFKSGVTKNAKAYSHVHVSTPKLATSVPRGQSLFRGG